MSSRTECPAALVAIALLALLPAPALAAPVIDLSWDACSPIAIAKQPGSGETVFSMFLSVTGLADTHTGYSLELFLAGELGCDASASTPDAWRFDSGGCQGRALGPVSIESTSAACPALAPPGALSIVDFSRIDDPGFRPVGAMRLVVAAAYSQLAPQTADPGQRYQLFRMDFHHEASVSGPGTPGLSCGGYEAPICIALFSGVDRFPAGGGPPCSWGKEVGYLVYSDADRHDVFFTHGQDLLSFGLEPGTAFSCFEAVPARGATWGEIKAQYR